MAPGLEHKSQGEGKTSLGFSPLDLLDVGVEESSDDNLSLAKYNHGLYSLLSSFDFDILCEELFSFFSELCPPLLPLDHLLPSMPFFLGVGSFVVHGTEHNWKSIGCRVVLVVLNEVKNWLIHVLNFDCGILSLMSRRAIN